MRCIIFMFLVCNSRTNEEDVGSRKLDGNGQFHLTAAVKSLRRSHGMVSAARYIQLEGIFWAITAWFQYFLRPTDTADLCSDGHF